MAKKAKGESTPRSQEKPKAATASTLKGPGTKAAKPAAGATAGAKRAKAATKAKALPGSASVAAPAAGRPATRVSIPAPAPVTAPQAQKGDKDKRTRKGASDIKKLVYFFAPGEVEGDATMRDLLGGKGAGLAGMAQAKLPVPPGFTITTEACNLFYGNRMRLPQPLKTALKEYMRRIEAAMGRKFGSSDKPLLVSVRSGAKFSMPGMMDTILNLGLSDKTLSALIEETDNARFAYDNYRRFIQMFANVVLGIDKDVFEGVITQRKKASRVKRDASLSVDNLKEIITEYKKIVHRHTREPFPDDPWVQLTLAVEAVFKSWNNPRAITYRKLNDIPSDIGTAVNVQAMVFGNTGENSATGVGFTRNPSTGAKEFYGEFLTNAQGEDVVAGVRTPRPIAELKELMPSAYKQLKDIASRLEKYYRDIQDFEFTIQDGELFMLQTRTGKRTAAASVQTAVDMVKEGLITKDEAMLRINPEDLDQLLHPRLDPAADVTPITKGLAASPGAASGKVVFTAEDAALRAAKGDRVILVRNETNPDDIQGMAVAAGILTARGGMTSHAAVVARGMGKCCVVGAEAIRVNEERRTMTVGATVVREKQVITLDGSTGNVMLGEVPTIEPELSAAFTTLMSWVDKARKLGVRTNADTPEDAARAVRFGAEGIGLCRTEHMFFAPDRLPHMRRMILADTAEERQLALNKLLPYQRSDFKGIFRAMDGLPVTIRTLDPPLHEFLPQRRDVEAEITALRAKEDEVSYEESLAIKEEITTKEKTLERLEQLVEQNPMLGHRGCRLGITYPEITEMQAKAIFSAACDMDKEGIKVHPEVMIPLVGTVEELRHQREIVERAAEEVFKKRKLRVNYRVGTMIEVPRAALTASRIAEAADFFSFGTNDLTQMTMGFSRDDTGRFMGIYIDKGILPADPFVSLDLEGVGQLVELAVERGRATNPKLSIGICGEHGGDPRTIAFCSRMGLSYVSCSPYRVPIARLAAAQAQLGTVSDSQK
ncbi:MAG TPA: pyruvate, phosphate dikinase [Acidobacteriota bacterium]|nr:pyruvate, phosphate dikinase [Acidobacteriota bacterium]